nr:hypothetical protein [Microbacterium bovistercoris]
MTTFTPRRLGAYVLPGDPTWLGETLGQYYPLLDDLVVPVPRSGVGWSGKPILLDECLGIIRAADDRGILRVVEGDWIDPEHPLAADTAQRQAALRSLRGHVDWVLQFDGDEFLPRPAVIAELIDLAEAQEVDAVEIPMRVLYRRTKRHVWEVVESGGETHHEYPGSIILRPEVNLVSARRTAGPFIRVASDDAVRSLQLARPPEPDERRVRGFSADDAIVHNSWARSSASIRRKATGWGHARQFSFARYFWLRWWPTPVMWWSQRDVHPFSGGLWPRLRRIPSRGAVADSPSREIGG